MIEKIIVLSLSPPAANEQAGGAAEAVRNEQQSSDLNVAPDGVV